MYVEEVRQAQLAPANPALNGRVDILLFRLITHVSEMIGIYLWAIAISKVVIDVSFNFFNLISGYNISDLFSTSPGQISFVRRICWLIY
jgi:hypothetical protein